MTARGWLPSLRAGLAALLGLAAALAGCSPAGLSEGPAFLEERVSADYCRRSLSDPGDPEEETDGGLGGTGILGVISVAGQVRLGRQDFLYHPGTQVDSALGDFPVAELRRGDTVVVTAMKTASASCATGLAHYLPVIGEVAEAGSGDGGFRVLGAQVELAPGSEVEDASGRPAEAADLADGTKVAVSGLWRDGHVRATHVRIIGPGSRVRDAITGPLRFDENGDSFIGDVKVTVPGRRGAAGSHVTLDGSRVARTGIEAALGIYKPPAPGDPGPAGPAGALADGGLDAAALPPGLADALPPDAADRWADRAGRRPGGLPPGLPPSGGRGRDGRDRDVARDGRDRDAARDGRDRDAARDGRDRDVARDGRDRDLARDGRDRDLDRDRGRGERSRPSRAGNASGNSERSVSGLARD
ncbi:DUF5666 domain-containing protein [Poseidonocella sp. HB161398]|uniref:DUF5666 domain-containing protein n=1 Tax=Poseidonocella sp. HB161398 TaxID=2320855 RepID=UPI001109C985|nr:DUF5666 domain-containing protein [Poseidonocella sp. HB161398]